MNKAKEYKKQLEEELKKRFHSPEKFTQEIEQLVLENENYNYITAIVEYCDDNDIDLEMVPKLLTKPLKEKLKWNATELNFLKKTSLGRLPI
jgi:hypothetical protein